MLFDPDGPDLPLSLLRTHRSGNLLFIVGAGISKAAGLPLFGELADQVYQRLGQALPGEPGSLASRAEIDARRSGQYDRLIGLLEQRLVFRRADWHQPHNIVREVVAKLVAPIPRANVSAHADLLDLSRAGDGRPRLVTTNFDTLFERAWYRRTKQDLISSAGAGMPSIGSHEFTGVLHLHGRVADPQYRVSETDLVLTSANFGEAYMRNGWASRFVYDLLRRYTLLLIGYSADDPPMRYMLEATEEGRLNFPDLKPAFALVGDTNDDAGTLREAWRGKGVLPLVYPAPDHNHGALYRTLSAWAGLVRDPLDWSAKHLARLSSKSREEATSDERSAFAFLTRDVSSVSVAAQGAADTAWVEEILPADRSDLSTFIAWFRTRLDSAGAARYAVAATDRIKEQIAKAVDVLLRSRQPAIAEPYLRFWLLYIQANLQPAQNPYGRIRSDAGITTARINEVVAQLAPRLRIERRFHMFDGDESQGEPSSLRDLAQFTLEAPERNWRRQLEAWPADAEAEERLLQALDRALCETIELGRDAHLILEDGDLRSFDLALVHDPEPDEGLVEQNDRHKSSWRLHQPDATNQRFAPLVRMMTGIWRQLASRDAHKASRIATIWAERDAFIFKRLAAWAAVEGDQNAAVLIETYLRGTSRTRYWKSDNSPELVRFYVKRWKVLAPRTRRVLEQAIGAGMLPEQIGIFAKPGHRAYARALYTAREFARIRTGGGQLSRTTLTRLRALYHKFPDLPREMPIFAHLYNPSWSGSGYSADVRVLDQVSDDKLLETAAAFQETHRIEQSDLWTVFAQSEPMRAFAALSEALRNGQFPVANWQPFLSLYAQPEPGPEEDERPPLGDVLEQINSAPVEQLGPILPQLAGIVEQNAGARDDPQFAAVMFLWDRLIAVAVAPEQDEPDTTLGELVFSHPLGVLAQSLVKVLNSMRPAQGSGLPEILAARFNRLAAIQGRAGLIARGSLLQQLAFLRAIAPVWVDANLLPELLLNDDDAVDLMSVVARSVAPQYPDIFNRLKPAIIHALEHDRTDDGVREMLSGALIGAAFAVIRGQGGFELTGVECRQTLTRVSNTVLARMAWELSSMLRANDGADARGAFWAGVIAPFLRDYWPNDVSARTAEVSENLVHLPALAGTAFEQAVAVVLDLVCPIQRYEIRLGLGLGEEDNDFIGQYPRTTLTFVAGILDRSAPPPSDLGQVIESLLQTDPGIGSEPAFWRIRQMLRAE